MAKFNKLQNNFKSGQLSQLLDSRAEIEEYKNGLKTMKNAYPMKQGGAQKRTGSKFIADVTVDLGLQAGEAVRLFPFIVAEDETKYQFALVSDETATFATPSRNLILKEGATEFENKTTEEYALYDSLVSGSDEDNLRNVHSARYGNEVFFARGYNNYLSRDEFQKPAVLYRAQINASTPAAGVNTASDYLEFHGTAFTVLGQTDVDSDFITENNHGLKDGQRVLYTQGTNAIGGLTTANYYFVVNSTLHTFQLSATSGGGAITLTDETPGDTAQTFTPLLACPFDDEYAVNIVSPGTVPAGLSTSVTYYIKRVDNDRAELHTAPGGASLANITTQGAGTHTLVSQSYFFKFHTLDQYLDDANNNWTLTEFERDKALARPYQPYNVADISIQLGATTGTGITFTASKDYFVEKHVGSYFITGPAADQALVKVVQYVSELQVLVDIIVDPNNTLAHFSWKEDHWNDVRGYPGTITYFEGRLCWGGTEYQPGKIWFSKTDDVTVYMLDSLLQDAATPSDASGLNYFRSEALASDPKEYGYKDNISKRIAFLSEGRALEVGTTKDVKILNAPEGIGVGAPFFSLESETGALAIPSVRTDQSTLYIEALLGLSNFTLDTNVESRDRYISKQIGILNEEILEGDVQSMYFDSFRKIAYIIVRSGTAAPYTYALKGLHFDAIDNVAAWFEVDMTDVISTGNVLSVAGFDESEHLYLLIERSDNNVYFEKIVGAPTKLLEVDLNYLDSHVTGDLSGGTVVTGLDHLEGETITVLGQLTADTDRWVTYPGQIVSGNQTTLPSNTNNYVAGLPYTAELETMLVDGGLNVEGSSQGQVKRIDEVTLRLWNTTNMRIGDSARTYPVKFDNDSFYTGDKVVKFDQGSRTDNRVKILSQEAKPMFLTGLIIKGITYE